MPAINTAFRVFYESLDQIQGLTDVTLYVRRPDGVKEGSFIMTEIVDVNMAGTYYYDYTPTQIGVYLFSVDSISQPKRDESAIECLSGSPFALYP